METQQLLSLDSYDVIELNVDEQENLEGGGWFLAGLAVTGKVAAVAATGVGIVLVGAIVGYGVYKAVEYVSEK